MKILENPLLYLSRSLFGIIGLICIVGLIQTTLDLKTLDEKRVKTPYVFFGEHFEQFKSLVKNETHIGYIAQPDPKGDENVVFFTQGQMTMA